MKPEKIGRVVGIGMRVAGRMAGQRLAAASQTAPAIAQPGLPNRAVPPAAMAATRGAARGLKGILRTFGRVGSILWLEVTGLFFLIFVPVFIWRGMWPIRTEYAHGSQHMKFLAYVGLTLVFLYLGVSSFWRARKR